MSEGEIVFIKVPPSVSGTVAKLQSKYKGPYVVVRQVRKDIYCLQELRKEGSSVGLMNIHISQIRSWKPGSVDEVSVDED